MEHTSNNREAIIIITSIMHSAAGSRGSAAPTVRYALCTWLKFQLYSLPQAHHTGVGQQTQWEHPSVRISVITLARMRAKNKQNCTRGQGESAQVVLCRGMRGQSNEEVLIRAAALGNNSWNWKTELILLVCKPEAGLPSGPKAAWESRARVQGCRCADTTEPPGMCCRRTAPAEGGFGPSDLSSPASLAAPVEQRQPEWDLRRTESGENTQTTPSQIIDFNDTSGLLRLRRLRPTKKMNNPLITHR